MLDAFTFMTQPIWHLLITVVNFYHNTLQYKSKKAWVTALNQSKAHADFRFRKTQRILEKPQ